MLYFRELILFKFFAPFLAKELLPRKLYVNWLLGIVSSGTETERQTLHAMNEEDATWLSQVIQTWLILTEKKITCTGQVYFINGGGLGEIVQLVCQVKCLLQRFCTSKIKTFAREKIEVMASGWENGCWKGKFNGIPRNMQVNIL